MIVIGNVSVTSGNALVAFITTGAKGLSINVDKVVLFDKQFAGGQ